MPRLLPPLGLALVMLVTSACATVDRSPGRQLFDDGRYADAANFYVSLIPEETENETLFRSEAGVAALMAGDVPTAKQQLEQAFFDLEDLSATTGESLAATFGSASSRRWKGEPYERCMNAYYLGIAYWLLGDVDNAAAAFRAGVLRDADSEAGAAQSDFALLWFLLGEAQRAAHHSDRGAAARSTARALLDGPAFLEEAAARRANVVVVVETGRGPRKVAAGPHGSWLKFQPRDAVRRTTPRVSVDDRVLGDAQLAVNVHRQAITRGEKVLDHVNQGKAVFKDVLVVAGAYEANRRGGNDAAAAAMVLAGLVLQARADTRDWTSLPAGVHVLLAELPEGDHVISVDVLEHGASTGAVLRLPVTVRPGSVTLAYGRAFP